LCSVLPLCFFKQEAVFFNSKCIRNNLKKVGVQKGTAHQGYIAITLIESLSPFDEIVREGAYFLMAQSKKREAGVGHHH